jgi:fumarate reductase subunit D
MNVMLDTAVLLSIEVVTLLLEFLNPIGIIKFGIVKEYISMIYSFFCTLYLFILYISLYTGLG